MSHTASVHFGDMWLQRAPTKSEPMAIIPNTIELAALEISGLAPPPAPMPLRAPKIPGQVKAVPATMKAAKMVDRYHVTGCRSSRSMAILSELGVVDLGGY